jgi:seryl-tRNA synthetase
MKKVWPWVLGILVGLIIVAFLLEGRSERQAYRAARGAVSARVAASQDRIDTAVEMATAAVDHALEMAGNLPSQQAKADLVQQDIEEIGNRLKDASEARGEAAIEKLDASIEQFNKTMQTVEEASKEAESEVVQSTLDRIYGMLEATKEQLAQIVLRATE